MKAKNGGNLALAPVMAQTSAMGRRCGPAHLPAEVALVMLLVALAAQWCHLSVTPMLGGTSLNRNTEVAEAAGDQARGVEHQDGGVEQPCLENGSTPTQSSSSQSILNHRVPYVFYC